MNALAKLGDATKMLAEVRSASDAKKLMTLAASVEYYARKAKLGQEAISNAHAIQIEAQKLMGGYLIEAPKATGGKPYQSKATCSRVEQVAATLPELGVTRKESANAQFLYTVAAQEPELYEAVKDGKMTLTEVKTKKRRAARMEMAVALSAPTPLPRDRKYPVLLIDPPWKYDYIEEDSRAIENTYPTMTLAELCALPIQDIALADSVLFLWVTSPKCEEALELCRAWGFTYRTNMVWVKDKIGMGYYVRAQHELIYIAKRGELPVPEPFDRPSSVIHAPRGKHSAKPVLAYEAIERMYPDLPKIEIFARGAARKGWFTWGNQAEAANA